MYTQIRRFMQHFTRSKPAVYQDVSKNYQEAVRLIQAMDDSMIEAQKKRIERYNVRHQQIDITKECALHMGVTMSDIDALSPIHISGTKGKGSTSSFCESILRHHGYKTGFFSSPHLVEQRERVRINGKPLSRETFSSYFWECFDPFMKMKDVEELPFFFTFLTGMAFHVFKQEQVDVAIIEVGIGGRFDQTNIIRNPVVCGVSTLDMDHGDILGDSLEEIAWNKAGIFKHLVPAITVPQPRGSMETIMACAKETQSPLCVTKDLESYDWGGHPIELGIHGEVQKLNAALALDICNIWLRDHNKEIEERKVQYLGNAKETLWLGNASKVTQPIRNGLKNCHWAGRNQILKRKGLTYYIDGAHTPLSIQQCIDWFQHESENEKKHIKGRVLRILLFNAIGGRTYERLLKILKIGNFDCAIFCPNIKNKDDNDPLVQKTLFNETRTIETVWLKLPSSNKNQTQLNMQSADAKDETKQTHIFRNIQDALVWATHGRDSSLPQGEGEDFPPALTASDHIQLLCTGSLGLIGGVMKLVHPETADE